MDKNKIQELETRLASLTDEISTIREEIARAKTQPTLPTLSQKDKVEIHDAAVTLEERRKVLEAALYDYNVVIQAAMERYARVLDGERAYNEACDRYNEILVRKREPFSRFLEANESFLDEALIEQIETVIDQFDNAEAEESDLPASPLNQAEIDTTDGPEAVKVLDIDLPWEEAIKEAA